MANLGNLEILLKLSTEGAIESMSNVSKALEALSKKAAKIQLGFNNDAISSQLRDIVKTVNEVSQKAGTSYAQGAQKSAEATKAATTEMQQQVALSADLEAGFKELLGVVRSIAEAQKGVNKGIGDGEEKKKKFYDLERLHQLAIEKDGQLTKDQVAVWQQMEALLKSMVGIDEKYTSELYKQLEVAMERGGVTREQLGAMRALASEAQAAALRDKKAAQEQQRAARQQEQAARKQKQSAKEREAAAKRQVQLETSIIRVETQLLGVNEARLSSEAQLLVAKMRNGQITQEEVGRLSALLTQHRAIVAAEEKKGAAAAKTNAHLSRQSGLLSQITSYLGTYFSVIGAVNLIKNLVRITGEFEAQHVALRAILQDVAGADRIFYQLQELAVKSPFTFRNLTDYAKQLSAFSVPMNEIYDTTKRLADVSAGLGVDMSRIILAYGQIRSASFLRGQEVRQLTEAGIPVLQELSKQFKELEGEAVSVGKVFDKISARQVPFEMIEKMFKDLTSEGGKFYQMQEVLAETVKGKVSNLQDAWEIMLSKVGEDNSGFIKGVLDGVTNLIKNYKDLIKTIKLATVAYGSYRLAVMAATQAQTMQGLVMAATGTKINAVSALLTRLVIAIRKLPASIMGIVSKIHPAALGVAALTTAIAALFMRLHQMNEHLRETDKVTQKAIANAEASKSNIHYYIQRLKEAKDGTEEYNKARQAVIDNSGTYISATDAERLSLQNVDEVWVNICKHIEEATKLQAMQSVTADASARKQERQLKVMDRLATAQQGWGFSNEARMDAAARVRGEIDDEELSRRLRAYYPANGGYSVEIRKLANRLKDEFDSAEREYEESISRARQNLNDLTGPFEKSEEKAEEVLDGWRKRVNDYLGTVTGGTRGVKVNGDTNLADFAEGGAKALNELRKALELIPATEEDYKKVEADIKFWEKLSEAIYGAGNTEFNNSTKLTKKRLKDAEALRKEQIAAIKQSVQDLKEAKKWYDQLTPLLGSDNAKTLLASFNFAVPKEGFNSAFQGYADQLTKLGDENGAKDVMNWANGREIGDVLNSAKAVEKYTEALRDLEAQTKRLNLSGFAQELDKIIVDADSKNRQLETNWAQKAEELEKAKDGWIQRYRVENEKATAEDAEKAWKKFYDEQTAMAKKAIDTQREYNNKVAQEQINDKASKWLEEMMKENNIDLHDMGDKSLEQVNILISRMEELVSSEALATLIPDELKDDAALINVEFSKLLSTIKKMANTKLGDLSVEKMKKTLNGVKAIASTLGLNTDTSAVESSYSTLAQALTEVANAQVDVDNAQKAFDDAKLTGDLNAKAKAYRDLAAAQGILGQKTEEATKAQGLYNASIAMSSVGAFASAISKITDAMKNLAEASGNEQLSEFANVAGGVAQNLSAAASGYAAAASAGAGPYAWIGAVVGGVTDMIGQLINAQAEIDKYNYRMAHASDNWALAVARIRNEYALLQEQLDTMFGSATMSKMAGWAEIIRKQGEAIRTFNGNGRNDFEDFVRSIMNGDISVLDAYNAIMNETNKTAHFLAATNIKTYDASWWEELWGGKDAYTSLGELVPELFNDDGSLNFDYLDAFKQTEYYNELSDEWKQTLDEMEEANNAYMDAVGQMKDYLTSVFGEVGASITDQLISKFEETGQAAFDMGDILSDVAKKFVSDWTQAFLMKNYLNGLDDAINDIWMDSTLDMDEQISQSLGLLRDSLTAMSDRLPEIQAFYEGMEDQFHWADGAGEELGDAIKTALVEQNSSLIAGYINSMRADLTMQRNEIMRSISPAVTSISNGFNTHLIYMESVAGNVSNIWNRLDLLTSSGSGVKLNARI